MKKRMDSANKREKYIRARVNDDEMKEFDIACSMMEMGKTELIRKAIIYFLAKENIDIWK